MPLPITNKDNPTSSNIKKRIMAPIRLVMIEIKYNTDSIFNPFETYTCIVNGAPKLAATDVIPIIARK